MQAPEAPCGDGRAALPGRFRVLAELGRGGMGVVYLAHDSVLDREVAVKRLSFVPTPEVRARLLREARAAARLDHPGLVRIHDVLEDELCIVMEHVRGISLGEKMRQGPLGRHEVRALAEALLPALEAAHAAGVVHRDVKPGNVLLGPGGPKLGDFGIARVEGSEATAPGETIGTPAYMAPEQQADARAVDARADLFSLGVVLYEAACGRRPTTAEGPDADPERTVRRHTGDPLLAGAVARALRPRREDRWPDAASMRAAMTPARRRRPVWPFALALGVAGLAAVLALGDPEPPPPGNRRLPADFSAADAAFRAGRSEQARDALERVVRLEPSSGRAWFELAVSRWWMDEPIAMVDEAIARALAAPIGEGERICLTALREVARHQDGPAVARLRAAPAAVLGTLEAQYLLGEALYHTGKARESMRHFEKALELAPEFRLARLHAFRYRLAQRDLAGLERLLAWSRRHAAVAAWLRTDELQLATARRSWDRAISLAEEVVREPDHRAPEMLGQTLDLAGRTEDARRALADCAGSPREAPGCARSLAAVEASEGRLDLFDRWLRAAPPPEASRGADEAILRDSASTALLQALLGRPEPARAELGAAEALVSGGTAPTRALHLARLLVAHSAGDALPSLDTDAAADPVVVAVRAGLTSGREARPAEAALHFARARGLLEEASLVALLRTLEARAWSAAGDGPKVRAACEEVVHPPLWSIYRAADLRSCRRWTADSRPTTR